MEEKKLPPLKLIKGLPKEALTTKQWKKLKKAKSFQKTSDRRDRKLAHRDTKGARVASAGGTVEKIKSPDYLCERVRIGRVKIRANKEAVGNVKLRLKFFASWTPILVDFRVVKLRDVEKYVFAADKISAIKVRERNDILSLTFSVPASAVRQQHGLSKKKMDHGKAIPLGVEWHDVSFMEKAGCEDEHSTVAFKFSISTKFISYKSLLAECSKLSSALHDFIQSNYVSE